MRSVSLPAGHENAALGVSRAQASHDKSDSAVEQVLGEVADEEDPACTRDREATSAAQRKQAAEARRAAEETEREVMKAQEREAFAAAQLVAAPAPKPRARHTQLPTADDGQSASCGLGGWPMASGEEQEQHCEEATSVSGSDPLAQQLKLLDGWKVSNLLNDARGGRSLVDVATACAPAAAACDAPSVHAEAQGCSYSVAVPSHSLSNRGSMMAGSTDSDRDSKPASAGDDHILTEHFWTGENATAVPHVSASGAASDFTIMSPLRQPARPLQCDGVTHMRGGSAMTDHHGGAATTIT